MKDRKKSVSLIQKAHESVVATVIQQTVTVNRKYSHKQRVGRFRQLKQQAVDGPAVLPSRCRLTSPPSLGDHSSPAARQPASTRGRRQEKNSALIAKLNTIISLRKFSNATQRPESLRQKRLRSAWQATGQVTATSHLRYRTII